MNGKNVEARVDPSESVERTDQGRNSPVVKTDSNVLVSLVQETPMGRGVVPMKPAMDDAFVLEDAQEESNLSNVTEDIKTVPPLAPMGTNAESAGALLSHEESEHFRTLWNEIQGRFVDEPRSAVQHADVLVSEVIEKITQMFSNEHVFLEGQWKEGKDVSTEDLRKALQRYRSFFNRLVV
jgi:hypothetical protein